jgi:hypothetical protein
VNLLFEVWNYLTLCRITAGNTSRDRVFCITIFDSLRDISFVVGKTEMALPPLDQAEIVAPERWIEFLPILSKARIG